MTALTASETCRRVANIIDFEPDRFDMAHWAKTGSCGTTACIAGHTALLHNDFELDSPGWKERQAGRLGLTIDAGEKIFHQSWRFWDRYNEGRENIRYSKVLRQLEKELEGRDEGELVGEIELDRIAEEALR